MSSKSPTTVSASMFTDMVAELPRNDEPSRRRSSESPEHLAKVVEALKMLQRLQL